MSIPCRIRVIKDGPSVKSRYEPYLRANVDQNLCQNPSKAVEAIDGQTSELTNVQTRYYNNVVISRDNRPSTR